MRKAAFAFVALTMGLSGIFSPAHALDPVQCQPGMDYVLYYSGDPGFQNITGEEVTYCDAHTAFIGQPDVYSYTQYCGPCFG